jgi:hypothetical protein
MSYHGWKDINHVRTGGFNVQQQNIVGLDMPTLKALFEAYHAAGNEWASKHYLGIKEADGMFAFDVFYDDTADTGSFEAWVEGAHRVDVYVQVVFAGTDGGAAKGDKVTCFKAHQSLWSIAPKKGEKHKIRVEWEPSGEIYEGCKLVAAPAAYTADGNTQSSPLDNSASSSGGGDAFLDAAEIDLDGHDGLSVLLKHSSDNVTYATKGTFATITGTEGSGALALTGTINRYTAIAIDFTGTGTSPSANVSVALKRN